MAPRNSIPRDLVAVIPCTHPSIRLPTHRSSDRSSENADATSSAWPSRRQTNQNLEHRAKTAAVLFLCCSRYRRVLFVCFASWAVTRPPPTRKPVPGYQAHVDPSRDTVPFWGQTSQILSNLPQKRDCSPKRVTRYHITYNADGGIGVPKQATSTDWCHYVSEAKPPDSSEN